MNKVSLLLLFTLLAITKGQQDFAISNKIANSRYALLGQFTYQVSLRRGSYHFCSGAIINEHYVLTAAQCVQNLNASEINISVEFFYGEPAQNFTADYYIMHEDFNSIESNRNDIAVIRIIGSISWTDRVGPVLLPEENQVFGINSSVTVSGWGATTRGAKTLSKHVLMAHLFIADQSYCTDVMKEVHRDIYDTNICAYDATKGKGHCNADSGSPLTINRTLIGIGSWTNMDYDCTNSKYPGVYTRLSSYVYWIKKHTSLKYWKERFMSDHP